MKKMIMIMLFLCNILFCSACSQKNNIDNTKKAPTEAISESNMNNTEQNMDNESNFIETSTEPLQMKDDISTDLMMNLNDSAIDRTSLSSVNVTITNNSNFDIISGEAYTLKEFNGKQWVEIPLNIGWKDLGIIIKSGESHDFCYNLSSIVNFDSNVTYRIEKQAYMDQKEYILHADFTVK